MIKTTVFKNCQHSFILWKNSTFFEKEKEKIPVLKKKNK